MADSIETKVKKAIRKMTKIIFLTTKKALDEKS